MEPLNETGKKTPKYYLLDGLNVNPMIPEENFRYAMNFRPCKDEIILGSYLKCGTTWTQQVLYLLLHDAEPAPKDNPLIKQYLYIDFEGKAVESLPKPRVLKTHFPYDNLTINPEAKYIYVTRNVKDCSVSFHHHVRIFEEYEFQDGSYEDFFDAFVDGRVDYCDYFSHVLSWWIHKDDPNMLFFTYEEMMMDPRKCICKIAQFVGGKAMEVVKDEEKLNKVLQLSSFKYMKANEKDMQYECQKDSFFRKGVMGDWKNVLTPEQSKVLDKLTKGKFGNTGLDTLWKGMGIFDE